ncbi:helix-turn-helix domain-containing protein [Xenorhabdus szentirmaii]|uniref:DNA binding protein n=1 Tax=Xenorhabdus szentirmaii DSM 16338 TaxID=1427518 RepID=W1IRH6_9GAMM|nr:helix-turn-helix transcriptional regulator [Xenorhabdus szentirmaii]PHM30603.1 transcriptional regulator [Xenorhabdus szentirmaii DSM 16338]CDL81082.1 putative DNA binding protein [Xenorhabdus szentirmaii DSM 16338]
MNPQRLIDARKAKNLSQREVGEALGATSKDQAKLKIGRYERGVLSPPYDVACKIAAILDVPPCYFYIDDDVFAEQVLLLYKKNFCHDYEFENELIATLTTKTRKYEKAFEGFKITMEDFKNTIDSIKWDHVKTQIHED